MSTILGYWIPNFQSAFRHRQDNNGLGCPFFVWAGARVQTDFLFFFAIFWQAPQHALGVLVPGLLWE
jgi:hypothetical protein